MDRAVLDAYGWNDISTDCEFLLDYEIDEETWGRKKKPYRYRWPDDVRDEVLARLLELNAERAAEEARAGIAKPKRNASGRSPAGGPAEHRQNQASHQLPCGPIHPERLLKHSSAFNTVHAKPRALQHNPCTSPSTPNPYTPNKTTLTLTIHKMHLQPTPTPHQPSNPHTHDKLRLEFRVTRKMITNMRVCWSCCNWTRVMTSVLFCARITSFSYEISR